MLKSDSKENSNVIYQTTNNSLTSLPPDILFRIFDICALKEQLVIAKVCNLFRQIIQDIYKENYKFFSYNYLTFKCEHLMDFEISEFCCLCGESVERLRFNATLNRDLIEYIEWSGISRIPLEDYKYEVNDNLKQNLKYFINLQELEIVGNLLQDEIILELSKSCKQFKTLKLLDKDNFDIKGKYLAKIKTIENLELKSCTNLDFSLFKVCKKRKLRSLNIMDCERLQDINKILNLSKHWKYLETLRLTAFSAYPKLLKSILNLPCLRTIQFFALNVMPPNFEDNFFQQLKANKTKSLLLKYIKFENDIYNMNYETLENLSVKKYAEKRESICLNSPPWQWSKEMFVMFSKDFEIFKNLKTLELKYCRLLNYQQLKRLCIINQKLKSIKIYGCAIEVDDLLKKCWQEDEFTVGCQLNFESQLTWQEIIELKQKYSLYSEREPVLQSIECQFHGLE